MEKTEKAKLRQLAKAVFSAALLVLFLYLLLRNIDLLKLKEAFLNARWTFIGVSMLCIPLLLLVRAWRWKYLLSGYRGVRFSNVFEVVCISRALANILPFRAADIVQSVHMGRKENISQVGAFGSVASERVMDLLYLIVYFALLSALIDVPGKMKTAVYLFSFLMAGGFIVAALFVDTIERIVARRSAFIAEKLRMFKGGLTVFKSGPVFVKASFLTVLSTAIGLAQLAAVLYAFGIPVSFTMLLAYTVVPAFSTVVPSTPGFIGVWDFFAVSTLTAFSVDRTVAFSATTVFHAIGLLGPFIFAAFYIIKEWMLPHAEGTRADGECAGAKR